MERIKSGIKWIDKNMGGFPAGQSILITGGAGCGKTILGLRFAKSACEEGYKTVYITAHENSEDLHLQAESLGWNIHELEEKNILRFVESRAMRHIKAEIHTEMEPMKANLEIIMDEIPANVKVVIIDNLGKYTSHLTQDEFRDQFNFMLYQLKKRDITSFIILDNAIFKQFNEIALHSVDGAIKLSRREDPHTGKRVRVMDIIKMRGTKTPLQYLIYDINKSDGIIIKED